MRCREGGKEATSIIVFHQLTIYIYINASTETRDPHVHNHRLFFGATLIFLSSSLPLSPPPLTSLPCPCGHLYSSTSICCHPASVTACSELLSRLESCSACFPPLLSSVPLFCISPTHFLSSWQAMFMSGCSSINNHCHAQK